MEGVVANIAQNNAKDLVIGAVKQLRYACCFNKFVKELEEERGNLIARRNGVQKRVKQAKEQTKEPAEVMEKWLKDANNDIDEADELLKKAKTKKSCLPYCPNWFCRWYLGRELEDKKVNVEKRTKEGDPYVPLERITTLPSGIRLDCGKCIHFESRQSVEEQLMKAVKDEDVSLIGLYGMGGCGKTTLAAQVGNKAKEENLFDKVLFVPVSSVVEIRKIQDKIASSLSYEFPPAEIEVSERAKRLHMRLSPQENKILVILDDVWQKLNFGAIGIPYSVKDPKSCCKVLITTRSEDVCKAMDCHKNIHLPILTDDEAWSLFKSQANISELDTLKDLARKVSDECKGLPVAISAVASTLKGKEEVAWKAALTRLTSSVPLNIEKGLQDPYKCLQLSYDNLDSPEAKSLLFLCSVFPEDDEIPVEYLTRFAIGLGIVGEVRTYEGARNEVTAAKNKLISSCLLLDVDNGEGVKMHDLVRDVAQWIGKSDNKAILCISKNDVTLEENNSIRFLWCDEFPNELDPSNLEFLHINTGLEVSDEVFKRMRKLRVLVLLNSKKTRPLSTTSFRSLTNLRCLLLVDWELSDFSFLGGMQKLEGLSMFSCSLRELPDDVEVTQQKKLKLFDLFECSMERNNFEVIGRLPELEELYILDERSEWDVCSGSSAEFFNNFSVPQKLQRHVIQLGTLFEDEVRFTNHKALCLSCFHTSNMAIKGLAKKSNALAIANIQGRPNSIIPDIFQIEENGMNHLIKFWIRDSDEMKYLIDTSNHLSEVATLFPKLVELRIKSMKHLESLWNGHLPPNGDFHKLESLYVSDCPELTSLFTPSFLQLESNQSQYLLEITPITPAPFMNLNSAGYYSGSSFNLSCLKSLTLQSCPKLLGSLFSESTAQTLTSLEYLWIQDCQGLKHIIQNASENPKEKTVEDGHDIIESDTSSVLSRLQSLYIFRCESLQYAFPISFARCLAKLKFMTIADTPNLKYIFGQSDVESCLEQQKFELPVLEKLKLSHTQKMISFCPRNSYVMCPSLQTLNLSIWEYVDFSTINCSTSTPHPDEDRQYQDYITIKVSNSETLPKQLQGFNKLVMRNIREIELNGIEKVKYLFTLSNTSSMLMLETLRIAACSELKHIIDIGDDCAKKNWDDVFPSLKELSVDNCDQLEYMFGQYRLDHQNYKEIHIHFSVLEELFLQNLTNFNSICPARSVSITWPSLKMFEVNGCSQFINSSISNLMVSLDSRELIDPNRDISGIHKHFLTLESLIIKNSKLESIFSLGGHQIVGQKVNLKLEYLNLESMPQIMYICVGSENSFSFENLQKLQIKGCEKLKVIFPRSIWRWLPELKLLKISECNELKQIIEEDEKSPSQPQPCFPKLGIIFIHQCHKLKRLFSASASNDLPSLEVLMISGASELEELIGCEQGKGYDIGEPKLELPNLKILMFMHLSSLRQRGTELQTVEHRVIHNCPKLLSLTSTATPQEFKAGWRELDFELEHVERWRVSVLLDEVSNKKAIVDPESHITLPGSEFPSSQNEAKSEKEVIEEVPSSAVPATIISTDLKQTEGPSPSSSEIPRHETLSHSNENTGKENVHEDAISEEARDEKMLPQDSQVVVPHPESTTSHSDPSKSQSRSYPLECDPVPENSSQLQMNHRDPALSKCVLSSSHTNQSTSGNLAETIHEQNQIESHKILESERESNHKNTTEYRRPVRRRLWYWIWLLLAFFSVFGLLLFLFQHNHHQDPLQYPSLNLVDQESIRERSFLDKQFVPEETINIENREEESIQEGPTFEKDSLEGLSLGGIAPNHNEFNGGEILAQDSQIVEEDNKPNEEGGIVVISNDSNEIRQGSDRSQSLIIAKLGECKHFVDMDDAQIALLAEAISAYPHLWNLCEKFSGRFQAWMLKTLADMLLFLRNESVISVTPQRLKDFHRLCDESAQFGFERSWIDEMRQRVMDKDPEVNSAQAQINELLQRHEQLTRELVEVKGKLNRLNDFVAARKKCFDFL